MAMHKKARVGVRIDMTPMVDVAFLLLIFFMSTTQFKPPEEAQLELPSSHSEIKLPESDVMILAVDKNSQVFFKVGAAGVEQTTSLADLEKAVMDARIRNPRLRLAIKADKDADYGVISDLMDILQRTGNTRFNMVTLLEEDKKPVSTP
ncbi:MAG: biopolymer transporter ExbD [Candidatus Latescibacteria bacterium]|nr:biopolymer transporter ExbD [Candidatus Latescibacterota bacterium]